MARRNGKEDPMIPTPTPVRIERGVYRRSLNGRDEIEMITIHAMAIKKFSQVNGFKASEEWYALVQRIADERNTTIGGAIQYVFNLGLPIYELVRANELETIEQTLGEIKDELICREIHPRDATAKQKSKKSSGKLQAG